jgi:hypothetical protein
MDNTKQIHELKRLIREARAQLAHESDRDKMFDLRDAITSMECEIEELEGDKS